MRCEDKRRVAAEMRASGMTCQQIANKLGMSDSWVHKWTPRNGKPWRRWTKTDEATLRKMIADGKSSDYIAHRLGRSVNAVRLKWMRTPHEKMTIEDKRRIAIQEVFYAIRAVELGCAPQKAINAVKKADIVGRYN